MKLLRIFILAFIAFSLIACGGAEERKAVYMEKAKSSIKAGDLDKARIDLKNVLQIDPKDAEAYYQLGKVYEQQKEYRKAYANYVKAEGLNPDLLENQAMLGRIYLMMGNDDTKAQEKIDLILAKDPANKDGLLLKSTLMLKNGKISEATEIAEKVVDNNPDYIDGATYLATLYFKDKKSQQAISVLDKALAKNPENEMLSRLLALVLVNDKQYERAEGIYKKLLEKHPDSRNSYNILATFYNTIGEDEKSEKILRDSIENAPKDVDRYLVLVKFIKLKEGDSAAIKELEAITKKNPGIGKLRLALGELYMVGGEKDSAIEVYKEVVSDFPDEVSGVDARIALASIYLTDKDVDRASEVVEDALSVSPNDPKVNYLRARIALFNKDIEKAIISLRIVTRETPENVNAFFLLVGAYQLENNKEQVKEAINAAYENNRDNPKALLKLAEYHLTKDIDTADKIIQEYNNLKPSDYNGMAIQAAILNKKKQYSEAYEISTKLMEQYADKTAGYYNAVPYLIQKGDKKKAIAVLKEGYENVAENRVLLLPLTQLQVSVGQIDEAKKRVKDELSASPENSGLKMLLAKIEVAKGETASAIKLLNEVIAAKPENEEAYLLLAQIYQQKKDGNAVESILIKGKANVTSSLKIPLRLSVFYESEKKYSKAIDIYHELYALHPENLIIINNLASMLSDHGDKADLVLAEKLALKLVESKQPVFNDTIGWVYYRLGDNESAIQYLLQAAEKSPQMSVFNYHLGMAYKQAGDKVNAKLYLEKSLANNQKFGERKLAEAALKSL